MCACLLVCLFVCLFVVSSFVVFSVFARNDGKYKKKKKKKTLLARIHRNRFNAYKNNKEEKNHRTREMTKKDICMCVCIKYRYMYKCIEYSTTSTPHQPAQHFFFTQSCVVFFTGDSIAAAVAAAS